MEFLNKFMRRIRNPLIKNNVHHDHQNKGDREFVSKIKEDQHHMILD